MKCDEVQDLLFDYLTGALSAEETASVRAHLGGGCAECAGALAEVEAVATRLLAEVDQVEPSAAIEERLDARLEDVNAMPAERSGFPMSLLAIAATALIAICGTWALRSAFESGRTDEIARMQAEIGRRKDEIGALKRSFDANDDFAIALRSADARLITFEPADSKLDTVVGRAIWDVETGRICLSVSGLPEARTGLRHSVWLDDGKEPRRLAGFKVTPAGEAAFVVELQDGDLTAPRGASIIVSLDASDAAGATPERVLLVGQLGSGVRIAFRLPLRVGSEPRAAG